VISADVDRLRTRLLPEYTNWDVVVAGEVVEIAQRGPAATLTVEAGGGTRIQATVSGFPEAGVGDEIQIVFDTAALFAFDEGRLSLPSVEPLRARARPGDEFER